MENKMKGRIYEKHATWELKNMKRALSFFLNTPEEEQRLKQVEEELKLRNKE